MNQFKAFATALLHFMCGVRPDPAKPKTIYRWHTFENGRSIWLTEGCRYADGSVYRLPPLGRVIWLDGG